MDRRRFLRTSGISLATGRTLGAAVLAGAACTPPPATGAPHAGASPPRDWDAVRREFALDPGYVHLALFFIASHPRPVREAIEQWRRAMDENPFDVVERGLFEQPRRVQEAAAAYVGARPEEISLTRSTTEGLTLVYAGLPVRAGQELLTTTHDHYSHHEASRLAAERVGATVRRVPLYDDSASASEDEIVARLTRAIRPATRAVGVTWVHSSTGVKLPVRRIADVVAQANAGRDEGTRVFLVVDGVHGFGVEDQAIPALGCDFFCAGTHKWIFGPRGTGIVWASADTWHLVRPTVPAFAKDPYELWMRGQAPRGPVEASWVSPGGFHAYEHQWALPAAFAFHQGIGRARVAARIHELNAQCRDGLAAMRHVRLRTPRSAALTAGLVCFDVEGMKPEDVVRRLRERRIIASTTPYGVSYARLAPGIVNSPQDVEAALRAVRQLGDKLPVAERR